MYNDLRLISLENAIEKKVVDISFVNIKLVSDIDITLKRNKIESDKHLRMKLSIGKFINDVTNQSPEYEYQLFDGIDLDVYEQNFKIAGEAGGLSTTCLESVFTGNPGNVFCRIYPILEKCNSLLWLKNPTDNMNLICIKKGEKFYSYINSWKQLVTDYNNSYRKEMHKKTQKL